MIRFSCERIILPLLAILLLAACANRRNIIIDTRGVDMAKYQGDLVECQSFAAQVEPKAGKGAVAGAVIGAAIGAAIGNRRTAEKLAGAGAVSGAVKGGVRSKQEQALVVRRCLLGRGYKVLN